MTTGRNDPCPCGSGQKYKSCCIDKQRGTSRGLVYLLIAIAVVAAVGLGATLVDRRNDARSAAAQTPLATTPKPQPPGPVPAGKVWSVEHGHWHNANATPPGGVQPTRENPITMNVRNIPQPPGPVPEGKVWSTAHGHWHTKK